MCHTELALKNKCNSLDWRHKKSFQIYLQDNLEPLVSGRKQNSMATQMLQFGRSVMTWHSKFFEKNCASSTCTSEEFFSNKNQNHHFTWIQTSAKGVVLSQLSLVFVTKNGHHSSDLQENWLKRRRISPYPCNLLSLDCEGRLDELGLTYSWRYSVAGNPRCPFSWTAHSDISQN